MQLEKNENEDGNLDEYGNMILNIGGKDILVLDNDDIYMYGADMKSYCGCCPDEYEEWMSKHKINVCQLQNILEGKYTVTLTKDFNSMTEKISDELIPKLKKDIEKQFAKRIRDLKKTCQVQEKELFDLKLKNVKLNKQNETLKETIKLVK